YQAIKASLEQSIEKSFQGIRSAALGASFLKASPSREPTVHVMVDSTGKGKKVDMA
ncbi:unnamed protein product, partial [Amoebophrya sp. A120]